MTEPTCRAEAEIVTAHASKYLQQLCKHFQHKIPATSFDPSAGVIPFPMGEAKLAADAERLKLAVSAPSAAELETLKDVVARHLVRFAFREEFSVDWRAAA